MSMDGYRDVAAHAAAALADLEEKARRQAQYERSRDEAIFQTAEALRRLNEHMDRMDQRLEQEHSAAEQARKLTEIAAAKQRETEKKRFLFTAVTGILTLAVGIVAAVGAVLALFPR